MPRGKFNPGFTVEGLDKAIQALRTFDKRVRERVMKGAFQAAMKKTLKAAKANAKKVEDSGALEAALCLVAKTDKRNGFTVVRVGVDKNTALVETVTTPAGETTRVVRRPVKYSHLVEFGARAHKIKRPKKSLFGPGVNEHPGVKRHPLIRAAWDTTETEALNTLFTELEKRIAKEVRKLDKS